MPQPSIRENQVDLDWLPSVKSFNDLLAITAKEDGDLVFVRDDDTLYSWDAPTSTWIIPAAYAKGFTSGCRLTWVSATSVLVNKGSIEIKGKVCEKQTNTTLTWTNLESGSTKGANKWYYVYLEKSTTNAKEFVAFVSDKAPTKDQYGNTIASSAQSSKYHPTRDARFVGTFRTDASQNIIEFLLNANYVAYIGQGSNYIMQNGNARTKTAVNCRSLVPPTSLVCNLYFQFNSGTNTRYVGDATSWFITATGGAGSIIMPITNDSVYYMCSGTNTVSLGIFGYYEDIG